MVLPRNAPLVHTNISKVHLFFPPARQCLGIKKNALKI